MRRLLAALAALLLLAWLVSFIAVVRASRHDDAAPSDAIVVLGAAQYNGRPSPVLRARLDHALALYGRKLAPVIIVTGGVGTRDSLSEAVVGGRYLVQRGVPDSTVIVEATGASSDPSLRAAAAAVRARGGRRIIMVSDGFHLLRLTIIAHRLGLEALGSPAPGSPILQSRRRELPYLLAESFKVPAAFFLTKP